MAACMTFSRDGGMLAWGTQAGTVHILPLTRPSIPLIPTTRQDCAWHQIRLFENVVRTVPVGPLALGKAQKSWFLLSDLSKGPQSYLQSRINTNNHFNGSGQTQDSRFISPVAGYAGITLNTLSNFQDALGRTPIRVLPCNKDGAPRNTSGAGFTVETEVVVDAPDEELLHTCEACGVWEDIRREAPRFRHRGGRYYHDGHGRIPGAGI